MPDWPAAPGRQAICQAGGRPRQILPAASPTLAKVYFSLARYGRSQHPGIGLMYSAGLRIAALRLESRTVRKTGLGGRKDESGI